MVVTLSPRVLELIVSRVCHDLVSPVGAISNGVELMEDMDGGEEALALIASSAHQAGLRLKFFRLAYGAAGTDKNFNLDEIKETFEGWLESSGGNNVTVQFDVNLEGKFSTSPKGFFKTVLNLLALAAECSHGKGHISISSIENGVTIITTGPKIKFRDGAKDSIEGKISEDDLDARLIHSYVSGKLIEYFDFAFSVNIDENNTQLSMELAF